MARAMREIYAAENPRCSWQGRYSSLPHFHTARQPHAQQWQDPILINTAARPVNWSSNGMKPNGMYSVI
eukprot:scaffold589010_cov19-Prasinocladus_malaysianus.AAC.1